MSTTSEYYLYEKKGKVFIACKRKHPISKKEETIPLGRWPIEQKQLAINFLNNLKEQREDIE